MELMDLLQTSKLIENYTTADLQGKERRTHLTQKLAILTNAKLPTCPQKMRYGLETARQQRIQSTLEKAKEIGLYSSTTKGLYTDLVKEKRKVGEKKKESKGLNGSIGKFKGGTLFIGKKDIENAGRGEKGNFGQVKRNFEVVNRPKSKGIKKNKKRR